MDLLMLNAANMLMLSPILVFRFRKYGELINSYSSSFVPLEMQMHFCRSSGNF